MPEKEERAFSLRLLDSLLDCDQIASKGILDEAKERFGAEKVLTKIIPFALTSLGTKWEKGEVALTQIYVASKIVEEAIPRLSPNAHVNPKFKCKVLIAALDYHGLGISIASKFLRASGVQVIDLGISLSPERLAEEAANHKVDAILLSALMLNSCFQTEQIKRIIERKGPKIPIMVGGAPFSFDKKLWKKVGADAVSCNVCETIKELQGMLGNECI